MKTFVQTIGEFAEGRTNEELTSALSALVLAVGQTGKKGSLTLKLNIEPNAEGLVRLTDEITVKIPQAARGASIFYVTEEGSLVKNNPRQKELPLRQVASRQEGPPRRVATSTSIGGAQAAAIADHLDAEDEREAAE